MYLTGIESVVLWIAGALSFVAIVYTILQFISWRRAVRRLRRIERLAAGMVAQQQRLRAERKQ